MRLRFSTFSCMAASLLIALDAAAIRSLFYRPEFLVQEVRWILIATLPMVNILAVGAYRARTPGAIGFQSGGWAALAATCLWDGAIFAAIEHGLVAVGADAWIARSRLIQDILILGVIPALFLAFQLLAAALGWFAALKVWGRTERPRPRGVSLAGLAVAALVPPLLVEATLRVRVDPFIARLEPGVRAVVDFDAAPGQPVRPPAGSPLLALAGRTVRVEADRQANVPEMVAASDGGRSHIRDLRAVQVSLVGGSGETVQVPYCTLRPMQR